MRQITIVEHTQPQPCQALEVRFIITDLRRRAHGFPRLVPRPRLFDLEQRFKMRNKLDQPEERGNSRRPAQQLGADAQWDHDLCSRHAALKSIVVHRARTLHFRVHKVDCSDPLLQELAGLGVKDAQPHFAKVHLPLPHIRAGSRAILTTTTSMT